MNGPGVEIADVTATHTCGVCETVGELPDIADRTVRSGPICLLCCPSGCSLCCLLDAECGDVRRKEQGAGPVLLPVSTPWTTAD